MISCAFLTKNVFGTILYVVLLFEAARDLTKNTIEFLETDLFRPNGFKNRPNIGLPKSS